MPALESFHRPFGTVHITIYNGNNQAKQPPHQLLCNRGDLPNPIIPQNPYSRVPPEWYGL